MFHNLCDFIKDEMTALDRKAASGKLSMPEIEYADKLAHIKKSILTVDAMENPEEYGYNDSGYNARSYNMGYGARGRGSNARRDSMGRYAASSRSYRDDESGMMSELRELMESAPNDHVRRKFEKFISEMETM